MIELLIVLGIVTAIMLAIVIDPKRRAAAKQDHDLSLRDDGAEDLLAAMLSHPSAEPLEGVIRAQLGLPEAGDQSGGIEWPSSNVVAISRSRGPTPSSSRP
ncbi:hypothetical protein [Rhodopseudomonas sp. P2A-2r]|uniref:hypothetical protein n=1 Tax=unclassified Rhodopseudomonas TaxID=2638247 RepID=UPI0022346E7B|nr:hypothetical protein [Rhodopseudomonas sp. P2A-2r]UZE50639.1 hypothetical protein ONR75_08295 [Rhodopseudomonas sp. P2A-2r]